MCHHKYMLESNLCDIYSKNKKKSQFIELKILLNNIKSIFEPSHIFNNNDRVTNRLVCIDWFGVKSWLKSDNNYFFSYVDS